MSGIAGAGGAVVVGAIAVKRKKILAKFRDLGALSPDSAKSSQDLGFRRSLLFRRMVRTGVLVDCGDGRYYLDETTQERDQHRRRRRAAWLVAVAIVAMVVVLVVERM